MTRLSGHQSVLTLDNDRTDEAVRGVAGTHEPVGTVDAGAPSLSERLRCWWTLGSGAFAITLTTSLYLLSGGHRRDAAKFSRWVRRMADVLMMLTGLRIQVHHRADVTDLGPVIFVANHQSVLDIPFAAKAVPVPFGFVAKSELARVPFLGHAIRYSPSVFLDRSNPRESIASIRNAGASIRKGSSVIIYPEGSRSYSQELGPFKKGAFLLAIEAGVPLVPLVIHDSCKCLNERDGWGRRGTVHVTVGEPIELEGVGRGDLNALMHRVRSTMLAELKAGFDNATA